MSVLPENYVISDVGEWGAAAPPLPPARTPMVLDLFL